MYFNINAHEQSTQQKLRSTKLNHKHKSYRAIGSQGPKRREELPTKI